MPAAKISVEAALAPPKPARSPRRRSVFERRVDPSRRRSPWWLVPTIVALALHAGFAAALDCIPLEPRRVPLRDPTYTQGLLWQITGPAAQHSYLFGTIHLAGTTTGQPTTAVTKKILIQV